MNTPHPRVADTFGGVWLLSAERRQNVRPFLWSWDTGIAAESAAGLTSSTQAGHLFIWFRSALVFLQVLRATRVSGSKMSSAAVHPVERDRRTRPRSRDDLARAYYVQPCAFPGEAEVTVDKEGVIWSH